MPWHKGRLFRLVSPTDAWPLGSASLLALALAHPCGIDAYLADAIL